MRDIYYGCTLSAKHHSFLVNAKIDVLVPFEDGVRWEMLKAVVHRQVNLCDMARMMRHSHSWIYDLLFTGHQKIDLKTVGVWFHLLEYNIQFQAKEK